METKPVKLETDVLSYDILASGSSGNCVVIGDVMVDCGISFKRIKETLYNIKYLLLTHIHSDHIKKGTLNKIKELFPHIEIIGNHEIHLTYGVDILSNPNFDIKTDHYTFKPFKCIHDVETHGYTWVKDDKRILYATDLASTDSIPRLKYDYLFLESNYNTDKLLRARNSSRGSYNAFISNQRHLSTEDCYKFYYFNRRDKGSELIELHKSKRYY